MALAEQSLGRIKALGQSADPKSYALWYAFSTGDNGSLAKAVNELLERQGSISAQDIDDLYEAHISPARIPDKVDRLGAQVADGIGQLVAMIEVAHGAATSYSANLDGVTRRLGTVKDREELSAIVEGLAFATREMETNHTSLQSQLKASLQEVAELRSALNVVCKESVTDALTSLGNRKYFDQMLTSSIAQCQAANEPLSLLLADIDHFKQVNDTYGHIVGDRVLRFVALTLERNIKGHDTAARYGGEEFAVILPKTHLAAAVKVAQHIRNSVMTKELLKHLTGEKREPLTISIGVATLDKGGNAQALIEAADVCLYAAKRSGRNRVMAETDEDLLDAVASKVA